MRILANRLKSLVGDFVSEQQKGFVPGCLIQDCTYMTQLIQSYIDETDESGLIIFADLEKAFDMSSWSYLDKAADSFGFGNDMRRWIQIMYNHDSPPLRRIKINGSRGRQFELHSGVPQGCPAAPLIFLIVTEALSRLPVINEDNELK